MWSNYLTKGNSLFIVVSAVNQCKSCKIPDEYFLISTWCQMPVFTQYVSKWAWQIRYTFLHYFVIQKGKENSWKKKVIIVFPAFYLQWLDLKYMLAWQQCMALKHVHLSVEWLLCSISESTSLFTFCVEVDFTFAGVLWLFGWCQCVRTCLMFLICRN